METFKSHRGHACDNIMKILPDESGIFEGACSWGGQVQSLSVIMPDSAFIPVLNYEDILPEFKKFLPVTDKCCVLIELKVIALVDYQTPICLAVFPFIDEWYKRQMMRGLGD